MISKIMAAERHCNVTNEYRIKFPILRYAFYTANVTLYAFAVFHSNRNFKKVFNCRRLKENQP